MEKWGNPLELKAVTSCSSNFAVGVTLRFPEGVGLLKEYGKMGFWVKMDFSMLGSFDWPYVSP